MTILIKLNVIQYLCALHPWKNNNIAFDELIKKRERKRKVLCLSISLYWTDN